MNVQTTAVVDTPRNVKLAPVKCAIWCAGQDGHTDATHTDDQVCLSSHGYTPLTAEGMKLAADDSLTFNALESYLIREAYSTRTLVHVTHDRGGLHEIHLTIDEARAHVRQLVTLLAFEQYERTGTMPTAPDYSWA